MGRLEQRKRIVVPVKVHGTNVRGEPFTEVACITDLSQSGARLEGAQCVTNVNEIITLEYQSHKVQFRVAWVGEPRTRMAGTAGLQSLMPHKVLFGIELPPPGADTFDPNLPHGATERPSGIIDRRVIERRQQPDRRKMPRYKCTGSAELRKEGAEYAAWGKVSDICTGGCYVELSAPMPVDTPVELNLNVCDESIHAKGAVRSHHPGFGMGIQFLDITAEQSEVLTRVVARLAGGVPPPKPKIEAPAIRPPAPPSVLEPLVQWFRTHETLSREDFLRLLEPRKEEKRIA